LELASKLTKSFFFSQSPKESPIADQQVIRKTQIISVEEYDGDLTSNADPTDFRIPKGEGCDLVSNASASYLY